MAAMRTRVTLLLPVVTLSLLSVAGAQDEEGPPPPDTRGLVLNEPREVGRVDTILNMSFGMLGINSATIIRRWMP